MCLKTEKVTHHQLCDLWNIGGGRINGTNGNDLRLPALREVLKKVLSGVEKGGGEKEKASSETVGGGGFPYCHPVTVHENIRRRREGGK